MATDLGWIQIPDQALLSQFWLDGFDSIEDPREAARRGRGDQKIGSPIYDYDNGGIGATQWVNPTENKAAILIPDGSWKVGGTCRFWISFGAGTRPVDFTAAINIDINAGDHNGWQRQQKIAIQRAEDILHGDPKSPEEN